MMEPDDVLSSRSTPSMTVMQSLPSSLHTSTGSMGWRPARMARLALPLFALLGAASGQPGWMNLPDTSPGGAWGG
jgi:hypothetical protein